MCSSDLAQIHDIRLLQFGTGVGGISDGLDDADSLHRCPALLSLLQNHTSFSAVAARDAAAHVNYNNSIIGHYKDLMAVGKLAISPQA